MKKSLIIIVIAIILGSCASIVSKSIYPVTINTNPNGCHVSIADKYGKVVFTGSAPSVVNLNASSGFFGKQHYNVTLSKEGYEDIILPISCSLDGWYFGNIIFGGLIGLLIVDPATGAMYKVDNQYINFTLAPKDSAMTDVKKLNLLNINDLTAETKSHLVRIK